MRLLLIIPVKRFDRAKSRLEPVLGPEERADLAYRLLAGVVQAARSSSEVNGVIVVTNSPDESGVIAGLGVRTVRDPREGAPLSEIVDAGVVEAARRKASHVLVLMSDLAAMDGGDVAEIADRLRQCDVVIAPDHRRTNTNALGFALSRRPPLAFGQRESFERHVDGARALGLTIHVVENPRLAFDVDTPEDFAIFSGRAKR